MITKAWDYPLSRDQKIQRVLLLFSAEDEQNNLDCQRLRRERNRIRHERDEYRSKCEEQEHEIEALRRQVAASESIISQHSMRLKLCFGSTAQTRSTDDSQEVRAPAKKVCSRASEQSQQCNLSVKPTESSKESALVSGNSVAQKVAKLENKKQENSRGELEKFFFNQLSSFSVNAKRSKRKSLNVATTGACNETENLELPPGAAGKIIGVQGAKIRKIRQDTGANIHLETRTAANIPTHCVIRIQGTAEQVQHARTLILSAADEGVKNEPEFPLSQSTGPAPPANVLTGPVVVPPPRQSIEPEPVQTPYMLNEPGLCNAPLPTFTGPGPTMSISNGPAVHDPPPPDCTGPIPIMSMSQAPMNPKVPKCPPPSMMPPLLELPRDVAAPTHSPVYGASSALPSTSCESHTNNRQGHGAPPAESPRSSAILEALGLLGSSDRRRRNSWACASSSASVEGPRW